MASANNNQPFRFMGLPGKLRNKVYALLLHPVEYEIDNVGEEPFGFRRKPNASFANSAILRTSSQVHREAYDMMVKDNQLVLFKDYVLEIKLYFNKRLGDRYGGSVGVDVAPISVMMLAANLNSFCEGLSRAESITLGLPPAVTIYINVAPALDHDPQRPHYQDSLRSYLIDGIKDRLLKPFRQYLRGFKKSNVYGHLSSDLAIALQNHIAGDECTNPVEFLNEIKAAKQHGQEMFQDGRLEDAYEVRDSAALTVDRLHYSSSRPILVESGGQTFINEIAHS